MCVCERERERMRERWLSRLLSFMVRNHHLLVVAVGAACSLSAAFEVLINVTTLLSYTSDTAEQIHTVPRPANKSGLSSRLHNHAFPHSPIQPWLTASVLFSLLQHTWSRSITDPGHWYTAKLYKEIKHCKEKKKNSAFLVEGHNITMRL